MREASLAAASIGPQRPEVRLPEEAVPTEIAPLVHAVNQAFERLEDGLPCPARFHGRHGARAAHAALIIRAQIDSLEAGPLRDQLRADIVNMTRTVNQVLDIAELESFLVATDARADLHEVCADAVAFMAPLACRTRPDHRAHRGAGPVWVRGHTEALFRAVRNLVENAIRHTPPGVSVEVEVTEDGIVRVLDDGPGVPEADRESIFRRFWRRDRVRAESPGLGLSIVSRIAEMHEASVAVGNRPGGGSIFTLRLRPAAS